MKQSVKMYKCINCEHEEVCEHKENMKKFTDELEEKVGLLEYRKFGVIIDCESYGYRDKTMPQRKIEKITI